MTDTLIDKKRIEWIDITKCIAIILVIIGHTVEFGGGTRNFIFSFHMPLFFMLSGYTYKPAESYNKFIENIKKGIKYLLIPALMISVISIILYWGYESKYDWESLRRISFQMGERLLWASGVPVKSHLAVGSIWFLFSLFYAKVILDISNIIFGRKYLMHILTFLSLLGLAIGIKGKWLPQNLDVTFVATLFVYLGVLWKQYQGWIDKRSEALFVSSILFWILCLYFNIYIELASRHYPFYLVSFIEAVCGSFAIACLCKALGEIVWFKRIALFIGVNTMIIYLVHHLDWAIRPLWQTESYWLTCFVRVVVVLLISLVIYIMKWFAEKWLNERRGTSSI